jgi:titin
VAPSGTNAAHTAALPNHRYGIAVNGMKNTIGGPTVAARNIIAGNSSDGVFLSAAASLNLLQGNVIAENGGNGVTLAAGATANVLKGNAIGTTPAGNLAYPNGGSGVSVLGASNTIGGTAAGAGNLIAGNTLDGVVLTGSFNLVQGNTIGANAAHTSALPNRAGLVVSGTSNTVGGTVAGAGNFIAGNAADGLDLSGGANLVQGNILAANGGTGLTVTSANNTLGGTAAGAGNIVALNGLDGVRLSGNGASSNRVQGNFLGTGPSGTSALGNGGNGVAVVNASNNTIGGTAAGAGNVIAFNGNDGVLVDTGSGNAIQQNSIFSSGNLGIELLNGANNNQAAPVLTAVTSDGSSTITGTLNSAPDTSFTVDLYANAVCNPSGYGEGQTFLGAATVTTDDSGAATFTVTLDGGVAPGQYVSATATDPAGNTSAFAACWQLPSTALPGLAAVRTTGLANPLSPTSSPVPVSLAQRRADALFRTLGPEVRRPSPQESKSFAGASGLAAAPPTGAGESGEVLGDLLGVPAWSDSRW